VDVAPAGCHLAHRLHELGVGRLLEHVIGGAGRECLADVTRVVLHREDEHLRVRRLVQQEWRRVDPRLAGRHHVQQDHVRLQRPHLEHGLLGAAGLADDLDVGLRIQQEPEPGADDRVVVDDHGAITRAAPRR
jgi:hypothetical protein